MSNHTRRRGFALAAAGLMILVSACAEQEQKQVVEFDGDPPPDCPSYGPGDLAAARRAVEGMDDPKGDREPFVVLASKAHEFAMVVVRGNGEVMVIQNWADGDDQGLFLLAQPGDGAVGDFIYDDTALEDVALIEKQAVHISGCPAARWVMCALTHPCSRCRTRGRP